MRILVSIICLLFLPVAAHADSSAGAAAGSSSESGAASQSGAIGILIQPVSGGGASPAAASAQNSGVGSSSGNSDVLSPKAVGVGIGGGGGSAHNAGNKQAITFNSTAVKQHKNTPGLVAPALSSTLTDTCMGSVSAGVSGAGFGVTGGKTYVDQECVRRLHSKFLATSGQPEVAMQIMCGSEFVAEATRALAERTNGVDKCTGESYSILEPLTPADAGTGPVPLLGPDIDVVEAEYVDESFDW